MRPTQDYEHPTLHGGLCRVRIYEPKSVGDHHVVIITELVENEGRSVTNSIEQLAAELVIAHALPSSQTIFIEHYEETERCGETETFDLVTFFHPELVVEELRCGEWNVEFGEPTWKPLGRESVEVLLGHSLS